MGHIWTQVPNAGFPRKEINWNQLICDFDSWELNRKGPRGTVAKTEKCPGGWHFRTPTQNVRFVFGNAAHDQFK